MLVVLFSGALGLPSRTLGAMEVAVVVPLEAKGIDPKIAREATRWLVEGLTSAGVPIEVVGPAEAARLEGIDLLEQARGCGYDVFCLVEIGRLFGGGTIVVGALERRVSGAKDVPLDTWVLELRALDVDRAVLADALAHAVPALDLAALRAAARAGIRRLILPPDAAIELEVEPSDALTSAFGEPVVSSAGLVAFWAGNWRLEVEREGFLPEILWVEVPARRDRPDPVSVVIRLRPDPLHVPVARRPPEPFLRPSRRLGRAIPNEEAGAPRPEPARSGRVEDPLAFVLMGTGVIAASIGLGLALHAQGAYDARAREVRYMAGTSAPADVARRDREGFRSLHRAGTITVAAGLGVALTGLAWRLLAPPKEPSP